MRRVLAAVLLAVTACSGRHAGPPAITRVELRLVPDQGRAWVAFDSTGQARGGHMSGDATPMVHTDSAMIAADSVRAIFTAVRALDSLLTKRGPATDSSRAGTATIAVTFSDSTQAQIVWPVDTRPADLRVQAALEHLVANRVGGW